MLGAVAAFFAALSFDLFFTRPYYSLRIDRAEEIETAVLMLIVGVAIGEIVTRSKRDRFAAHVSRSNLERVSRITELAAGGEPPGRLIRVARRELLDLLDLNDCEFERPPFFDALPRLSHSGLTIPPTLGADAKTATDRSTRIELPIWAEGLEIGRFVLVLADDATGLEFDPAAHIGVGARRPARHRAPRARPITRAATTCRAASAPPREPARPEPGCNTDSRSRGCRAATRPPP